MRTSFGCAAAIAIAVGCGMFAQSIPAPSPEWPTYGHDAGGMRFSPLTQLTPANAANSSATLPAC